MPASRRSLAITDAHRRRVVSLRRITQARAEQAWPDIRALDGSTWAEDTAALVAARQAQGVALTRAYLAAFMTSETRTRQEPPVIDAARYVGLTRDGRPLVEVFRGPLIGVLAALKEGRDQADALRLGLVRARRQVGVEVDWAHQQATVDAIAADPRLDGWGRAVSGTCGACAAVAGGLSKAPRFEIHPGCNCVAEPRVNIRTALEATLTGAALTRAQRDIDPDAHQRPSGQAIFEAKSRAEQDEMLGAAAAEAVRRGDIDIRDLAGTSPITEGQNFITQKPLIDTPATTHTTE